MQTVYALQKKEQNKGVESALSHQSDSRVDLKEEHGTEAGVPLFLKRLAVSSTSTPPPVQLKHDDKDTEQILQTKPLSSIVQRDVLEEEEHIAQNNSVSPSIHLQPPEEQEEDIINQPSTPKVQMKPEDEEDEDNEEFPVFPKLTIGAPNDKYEQEADRVSDTVMRMLESSIQPKPT